MSRIPTPPKGLTTPESSSHRHTKSFGNPNDLSDITSRADTEHRTPNFMAKTVSSSTMATPSTEAKADCTPVSRKEKGDADTERVRVVVRVRPNLGSEEIPGATTLDYANNKLLLHRPEAPVQLSEFRFDKVLGPEANQQDVYNAAVRFVVEDVMKGYNGTVMAYGQTGAGKTYTLGNTQPNAIGMIPRAAAEVFKKAQEDPFHTYTVQMSYIQIYMEMIQDLLRPESSSLQIREDVNNGVFVAGVQEVPVANVEECLHYLDIGEKNRVFAFTHLNAHSSRSHAVVMLTVVKSRKYLTQAEKAELKKAEKEGLVTQKVKVGKLYLVDLAGSERLKKSGSVGLRAHEARSINLSLTTLGMCINARAQESTHVPFRDSKLTRLLQESLGGNARTSLVICVANAQQHVEESLQTLQFGSRAMCVKNRPVVNERVDYRLLHAELQSQMDEEASSRFQLEAVLVRTEEEKAALEAQLEQQRAHFAAILDALKHENQAEAVQKEKAQRQLDSTTRQLDELVEKKTEAEERVKELETEKQALIEAHYAQIGSLGSQVAALQEQLAERADAVEVLQASSRRQLAVLGEELQASAVLLDNAKDQNAELQASNLALKQELQTKQGQMNAMHAALARLQHSLAAMLPLAMAGTAAPAVALVGNMQSAAAPAACPSSQKDVAMDCACSWSTSRTGSGPGNDRQPVAAEQQEAPGTSMAVAEDKVQQGWRVSNCGSERSVASGRVSVTSTADAVAAALAGLTPEASGTAAPIDLSQPPSTSDGVATASVAAHIVPTLAALAASAASETSPAHKRISNDGVSTISISTGFDLHAPQQASTPTGDHPERVTLSAGGMPPANLASPDGSPLSPGPYPQVYSSETVTSDGVLSSLGAASRRPTVDSKIIRASLNPAFEVMVSEGPASSADITTQLASIEAMVQELQRVKAGLEDEVAGQRGTIGALRGELASLHAELSELHMQHLATASRLEGELGESRQECGQLQSNLDAARELLVVRQEQLDMTEAKVTALLAQKAMLENELAAERSCSARLHDGMVSSMQARAELRRQVRAALTIQRYYRRWKIRALKKTVEDRNKDLVEKEESLAALSSDKRMMQTQQMKQTAAVGSRMAQESMNVLKDAVESILTMFVTPRRDLLAHTRVLQRVESLAITTPSDKGTPGSVRASRSALKVASAAAILTPASAGRPGPGMSQHSVLATPLPTRPGPSTPASALITPQ